MEFRFCRVIFSIMFVINSYINNLKLLHSLFLLFCLLFGIILRQERMKFMQRYMINKNNSYVDLDNHIIKMMSEDAHHMKNVMRMNINDKVIVVYEEKSYQCIILALTNSEVTLEIEHSLEENKELDCEVCIAQGLVRKEKMEEVIDHISELGATLYQPVILRRCNVKVSNENIDKKLIRLNKIAKEASEQAHRLKVLEVKAPISFKQFLSFSKDFDLCLVAHVDLDNPLYIGDAIKDEKRILVLVGPEGGFDQEELDELKNNNFKMISLGKRVLRTEVAPSYIMSIVDYLRGENK